MRPIFLAELETDDDDNEWGRFFSLVAAELLLFPRVLCGYLTHTYLSNMSAVDEVVEHAPFIKELIEGVQERIVSDQELCLVKKDGSIATCLGEER